MNGYSAHKQLARETPHHNDTTEVGLKNELMVAVAHMRSAIDALKDTGVNQQVEAAIASLKDAVHKHPDMAVACMVVTPMVPGMEGIQALIENRTKNKDLISALESVELRIAVLIDALERDSGKR